MDVKTLYPSMEWKEIITPVREMVEESDREVPYTCGNSNPAVSGHVETQHKQ